jgi:ATP-binding cassette, subfamily B, bacterial
MVRRIAALFAPYRGRLAAVLALIAVSAGLGIISPFLLRDVLDEAIPHDDDALLALLVAGMIGISVATGVLGVGQTWSPTWSARRSCTTCARRCTATCSG